MPKGRCGLRKASGIGLGKNGRGMSLDVSVCRIGSRNGDGAAIAGPGRGVSCRWRRSRTKQRENRGKASGKTPENKTGVDRRSDPRRRLTLCGSGERSLGGRDTCHVSLCRGLGGGRGPRGRHEYAFEGSPVQGGSWESSDGDDMGMVDTCRTAPIKAGDRGLGGRPVPGSIPSDGHRGDRRAGVVRWSAGPDIPEGCRPSSKG